MLTVNATTSNPNAILTLKGSGHAGDQPAVPGRSSIVGVSCESAERNRDHFDARGSITVR